jgi:hypothetical protein
MDQQLDDGRLAWFNIKSIKKIAGSQLSQVKLCENFRGVLRQVTGNPNLDR